jgi:hypothetical protein
MIKRILSLLIGALMLSGCNGNYAELSPQQFRELVEGIQGSGSTMWRGTFYCGSDKKYDYFRHRRALVTDMLVKVETGNVRLPRTIVFPAKESEWIDVSQIFNSHANQQVSPRAKP